MPGRARRHVPRFLVPCAYFCLAAAVFATDGIPTERGMLTVWILGGLLCLSLGSLSNFFRSLLLEWLPLLAALTLYDVVRGISTGHMPIHAHFQIWLDKYVFGLGSVPSVWLQQHLWHPDRVSIVDYVAFGTYMSYFLVTPLALGALWLIGRPVFRGYARRLTLLSFAAVAWFAACPTMPPWLASQKGLIGSVQRLNNSIAPNNGWFNGTALWERGVQLSNDLAAFPSLHEGMTILLSIMLWRRVRPAFRVVLVAYPLLMAFSLVYLGEHYVSDLAAGALLTAAACYAEPRLLRALRSRRHARVRTRTEPAPELA